MPSLSNSKELEELINNLKSNLTIWEDLIGKSTKFITTLKVMSQSSSDMLDSLHSVCDIANKSNCCLKNTGINLTRLVLREKKIEQKILQLNNHINDNFVVELDKWVNEWRKNSLTLKKEREHDWKRANTDYLKSLNEVDRTEKKIRKKSAGKVGLSETANLQIEYANQDAHNKRRFVEDLERSAMRRAAIEERQRIKQFLILFKPILDCQLSLREDLDNLEEVVKQIYESPESYLEDLPEELEQNIQEHCIEVSQSTRRSSTNSQMPRSYSGMRSSCSSLSSNATMNSNNTANQNTAQHNTSSTDWMIQQHQYAQSQHSSNENAASLNEDGSSLTGASESIIHEEDWHCTLTSIKDDVKPANNSTTNRRDTLESTSDDDDDDDDEEEETEDSCDGIIEQDIDHQMPPPDSSEHQYQNPIETLNYGRVDGAEEDEEEAPLPPPPPVPTQTQTSLASQHQLYPNQSMPSPVVYSNLQELRHNAEKKFNLAPKLSAQNYAAELLANKEMEGSTSFASHLRSYSPPMDSSSDYHSNGSFTLNYYQNKPATMLSGTSGTATLLRRGSLATNNTVEMQVPQTPINAANRKSIKQQQQPLLPSNQQQQQKIRGRSASMSREALYNYHSNNSIANSYYDNNPSNASIISNTGSVARHHSVVANAAGDSSDVLVQQRQEDFNTIRQRIVNKINNELHSNKSKSPPPTIFPKPSIQSGSNQQPQQQHQMIPPGYCSPPPVARTVSMSAANHYQHQQRYQFFDLSSPHSNSPSSPPAVSGGGNHDNHHQQYLGPGEALATPPPPTNTAAVTTSGSANSSHHHYHSPLDLKGIDRKEDKFKQQLMQVLQSAPSNQPLVRSNNTNNSNMTSSGSNEHSNNQYGHSNSFSVGHQGNNSSQMTSFYNNQQQPQSHQMHSNNNNNNINYLSNTQRMNHQAPTNIPPPQYNPSRSNNTKSQIPPPKYCY